MKYVIQYIEDPSLLWSDDEGWTDSDNFESYDPDEIDHLNLPMGGQWIRLKTS
jgi:hypothetical protein